ncbi:hypothetical protein ACFFQW_31335 [Umezawaea endophytica]|uniref:Uncharacterized protein n=1 Tax=Umezawaea endophytica TaxID=1654476 RepID=A0A9X2VFU0_9PSEU|nr:hypothetical protein [Umezawaea endophytica]MCS7475359.1 hypothetical protein [Umezawaea endophytica]
MTGTRGEGTVDVERLLWRLADRFAPSERAKPTWFDHAGDLVVANGQVIWETPWETEGGFVHTLPPGAYPVHVGTSAHTPDDRDPDAFRYTTRMLVITLAEPERIVDADWDVEGYDDIHEVEDYAVLWGEEAMRSTLPHPDKVPAFFHDVRERIETKGPFLRRDNWAEVVLDQETGVNALVFPIIAENLTGYEIVDDEENLLCLVLTEVGW